MNEIGKARLRELTASRRGLLLAAGGAVPAALLASPASASAESTSVGASSQFAPVPVAARPPLYPASGYLTQDLGGGVYGVRQADSYQWMFLVARRGVVVVDAPLNFGDKILAAIGEVTDKPVTHFVYSHAHVDHTGGAHLFAATARYVGHELTAQLLKQASDPRRPVPTETFAGARHVLDIDGQRLVLDYRGDNHLAGNLFIHAPEQKVLMLVDVITPRWTPFFRLALTPDYRVFKAATGQVLGYDFTTVITGHAGHFGNRADIETHGAYLADLEAAAGQALGMVDYADAVKNVDPDNYQAQNKVLIDTVATQAAQLMPAHWLTDLGGADVFLHDNTIAVIWSMVID
jgi:glyoxylase-like metal-dependent hydrolase (beta-lactamase superfamily II)